jgi:Beta-lactamase
MSTPEVEGMDSKELAKLVDWGTTHSFDSLLVVRHGKIVAEAYYAPYTAGIPHAVWSVTKSVIGTLTAIAWKDGLLDSHLNPVKALLLAAVPVSAAVCAKFRPLASHGTPWRYSKTAHRCDTRRHGRSGDHKRGPRRVF